MNKQKLIILTIIITFLIFIGIFFKKKTNPICKDCNVVFISLDTLSAKHLPCYGYLKNTAPNICAIAKKSLFFENNYSNSFNTLPSHFSIFTSLNPSTHKMIFPYTQEKLNTKYKTIFEIFKNNGYLGTYIGTIYDSYLPLNRDLIRGIDYRIQCGKDETKRCFDSSIEALRKNKKNTIFLHTYYVHGPYIPINKNILKYNLPNSIEEFNKATDQLVFFSKIYLEKLYNSLTEKEKKEKYEKIIKTLNEKNKDFFSDDNIPQYIKIFLIDNFYTSKIDPSKKEQVDYFNDLYDEKIIELDQIIGDYFKKLEQNKLLDKTIVILMSDHGEEFMEHGSFYHAQLFNEIIKTPLIIHVPNIKPKKINQNTSNIDIYPTVLSILGIKKPNNIQGYDFYNYIFQNERVKNRIIKSERFDQKAYILNNWKLYLHTNRILLFNLKKDPNEKNNLLNIFDTPNTIFSKIKQNLSNFFKIKPKEYKLLPDWMDEKSKEKIIKEGYF